MKKNNKNYKTYIFITYIFITLLLLLLFYFYFYFYKKNNIENFSFRNKKLNKILNDNNYFVKRHNNSYIIYKKNNNDFQQNIFIYNRKKNHNYLTKHKNLTSKLYKKNKIPIPKFFVITKNNSLKFYNKNLIKYPCVLKPANQGQGKDVFTNINNKEKFNSILDYLLNKYNTIMYEEQIEGDDYRIFMFNNKVIDIIHRIKPYIIGDGINTIKKLIDNVNQEKKNKRLFKTKMKVSDWDYIKTQGGYDENSILEKDKKIYITRTVNLHNGAIPERILVEKIPSENIKLFEKVSKITGTRVAGLDYISPDITVPYYKNNGVIIEINGTPGTIAHGRVDQNNESFLYKKIFEELNNITV